jgi:putative membrane protein
LSALANALAFVALGILVYGIGLVVLIRALPGNLWKQATEDKSIPASIVLAGIALGLGWIVAAAVH